MNKMLISISAILGILAFEATSPVSAKTFERLEKVFSRFVPKKAYVVAPKAFNSDFYKRTEPGWARPLKLDPESAEALYSFLNPSEIKAQLSKKFLEVSSAARNRNFHEREDLCYGTWNRPLRLNSKTAEKLSSKNEEERSLMINNESLKARTKLDPDQFLKPERYNAGFYEEIEPGYGVRTKPLRLDPESAEVFMRSVNSYAVREKRIQNLSSEN